MKNSPLLTPAIIEDVPLIQSIAYTTWPATFGPILSAGQISYMLELMYNQEEISRQIRESEFKYYLIHRNVGFAATEFHYQATSDTKIHKLYLLPRYHGKGWGRQVISHLEAIAAEQGDQALILNVNKRNPAIGFYEKHGFSKWKSEVIDIGNGYVMDDYVYRKEW